MAREPATNTAPSGIMAIYQLPGSNAVDVSTWPQDGVGTNNKGDDRMTKQQLAYTYDIYIGAPVSKVWKVEPGVVAMT